MTESKTNPKPDTKWDDTEIVLTNMSPYEFVFDRMTDATIEAGTVTTLARTSWTWPAVRAIDAFKIALSGATVFGLEPSDIMLRKVAEWVEPDKSRSGDSAPEPGG